MVNKAIEMTFCHSGVIQWACDFPCATTRRRYILFNAFFFFWKEEEEEEKEYV